MTVRVTLDVPGLPDPVGAELGDDGDVAIVGIRGDLRVDDATPGQLARALTAVAALQADTRAILDAAPDALLPAIADAFRRTTLADAVLVLVPGRERRLEPAVNLPFATVTGESPVDPAARARRTPVPVDRIRRRSERLVRDGASGPILSMFGDLPALGVLLGPPGRPHAVAWCLRARGRPPFAEGALAGILPPARMALGHAAMVRELEGRLASMGHTRARLEDDARAAQVGRVAIDTLRALQSPLAYIRTHLRSLQDVPEASKYLGYALEGLARAERLVEDASRLSEARARVPIEVRQLVAGALALARPLSVPEYVEIERDTVLLGNPGRLTDAVAELLHNASQAANATRIDVRASRQGEHVSIDVVDDGEGIPDDLLERVLEPFFSSRGRSGLGLSTARAAVEAGGGTLQLWSRPGIGTTVQLLLPAADPGDDAYDAFDAGEIEAEE